MPSCDDGGQGEASLLFGKGNPPGLMTNFSELSQLPELLVSLQRTYACKGPMIPKVATLPQRPSKLAGVPPHVIIERQDLRKYGLQNGSRSLLGERATGCCPIPGFQASF